MGLEIGFRMLVRLLFNVVSKPILACAFLLLFKAQLLAECFSSYPEVRFELTAILLGQAVKRSTPAAYHTRNPPVTVVCPGHRDSWSSALTDSDPLSGNTGDLNCMAELWYQATFRSDNILRKYRHPLPRCVPMQQSYVSHAFQ